MKLSGFFMFTGIIQQVSKVRSVNKSGDSMRLEIDLTGLAHETNIGDSIAVNGVCLTVTTINGSAALFDVSGETLSKSNLAELNNDIKVNIEPAMKATDRFGGHIVMGHVDGKATIKTIENKGEFWDITFNAESGLLADMIKKGSVAVNGVSLTVARIDHHSFTVAVIPLTYQSAGNRNYHGRSRRNRAGNFDQSIKRPSDQTISPIYYLRHGRNFVILRGYF